MNATKLFVCGVLFCLPLFATHAVADPGGTATMSLEKALQLYQENESARTPAAAPPPVAASLQRVEARARLLEAGVELSTSFTVTVLASGSWSRVPLLALDADTHVTALPVCEGCRVVRDGDELVFLGHEAATREFEVRLWKDARREGRSRLVTIATSPAAAATLHVRYDEGLMRIESPNAFAEADGAVLYGRDGRFALRWRLLAPVALAATSTRAPVDPVIATAHASLVSTLEGRRTVRMLYELRLTGEQRLACTLPEHARLTKVFINQNSVTVTPQGRRLELVVGPARAGDEGARVELVYEEPQAGYLLSGTLAYEFPTPSWRTNQLWVTLHLPDVFTYAWSGGSLAPGADAPSPSFSLELPTPGRVVVAKQQLVASAPELRLAYAVDLANHYFR